MGLIESLASSILDLFYPERCALCGAGRQERLWCQRSTVVAGLRAWDQPHLCHDCLVGLGGESVEGLLSFGENLGLPVVAAARTGEDLVRVVGSWKYHGLRGMAWPMASLLDQALGREFGVEGRKIGLVPVPLHGGRRRSRGFNQAEVLARLLADGRRFAFHGGHLHRVRDTGQQAKVSGARERERNMKNAFFCGIPAPATGAPMLYLVDDLVTSGATVLAAAEALMMGGWEVCGVLALGLAEAGSAKEAATG